MGCCPDFLIEQLRYGCFFEVDVWFHRGTLTGAGPQQIGRAPNCPEKMIFIRSSVTVSKIR